MVYGRTKRGKWCPINDLDQGQPSDCLHYTYLPITTTTRTRKYKIHQNEMKDRLILV